MWRVLAQVWRVPARMWRVPARTGSLGRQHRIKRLAVARAARLLERVGRRRRRRVGDVARLRRRGRVLRARARVRLCVYARAIGDAGRRRRSGGGGWRVVGGGKWVLGVFGSPCRCLPGDQRRPGSKTNARTHQERRACRAFNATPSLTQRYHERNALNILARQWRTARNGARTEWSEVPTRARCRLCLRALSSAAAADASAARTRVAPPA
jgi:hypothetical protein